MPPSRLTAASAAHRRRPLAAGRAVIPGDQDMGSNMTGSSAGQFLRATSGPAGPDLNSNWLRRSFSDWPSCELTGTSDRSFSRANSAKIRRDKSRRRPSHQLLARCAGRTGPQQDRTPSTGHARSVNASDCLRRRRCCPDSDEITFGRTGISSSIAPPRLILAPKIAGHRDAFLDRGKFAARRLGYADQAAGRRL